MANLDELDNRIYRLLKESKDYYFTDYLKGLQIKLIEQQHQADLLERDLDRAYQLYLQRNPVQSLETESVEGVQTEILSVIPSVETPSVETPSVGTPSVETLSVETPIVGRTVVEEEAVSLQKKHSAEFAVGAVLLSVVGGVFILSALVMLGMNYMSGLVKGIGLYAICLTVLGLAELVLYKKWQRLGSTFSAIAVGGLYVTTLINYLSLHIISAWEVLGITVLITLFVIWLSRQRDSFVHRLLACASCFICCLMIHEQMQTVEFVIVALVLFAVNALSILIPVKRHRVATDIIYMISYSFFSSIFMALAVSNDLPAEACLVFVLCSLALIHLILTVHVRTEERKQLSFLIAYGISAVFVLGMIAEMLVEAESVWLPHVLAVGVGVIGLACFARLGKYKIKWAPYYLLNLILLLTYGTYFGGMAFIYCLVVLLVVAKLLALKQIRVLAVSDALLTLLACCTGLSYYREWQGGLLMAVLLLSILCIRQWYVYYEVVITFSLAFYSAMHMPSMLKLPVFVGVLFVSMLLYNHVKRWNGKYILVFNILVLVGEAFCMLLLLDPIYRNAYLTFLFMLIFGLATIILTFNETYKLEFRGKNMVLAVFLTYMALVFKTNQPIITSVLLMLIALVSVGIGFAVREKRVRVYGLVLSLLVCGKLAIYDFFSAPILQKTIVFLIVGMIALAIATVYMVLEKKQN